MTEHKTHSVQADVLLIRAAMDWPAGDEPSEYHLVMEAGEDALQRLEEQLEAVTQERDRLFRKNTELGMALAFERSAPNPASEPKEDA
jgi:hypothetical protein